MTEMIRPAATEEDKAIFDHLLQKISAVDSYFCCGGTLELSDRPLTLYYKSDTTGKSSWLDIHKLFEQSEQDRQTEINNLLEACVPAPHGRGDKTVLDESYRLARELRSNEFALGIGLLGEIGTEILPTISTLTAGRSILAAKDHDCNSVRNLTMVPRLYKLNAYSKNGFFKPHKDTPKGTDHVGTLMIALPIAHEGGALRVNHGGNEIVFDWHKKCSERFKRVQEDDGKLKISLPWAFLFSDVEHEVLPVESGTRVTIAYDIFSSTSEPLAGDMGLPVTNVDGTTTSLYNDFVAALRNPLFLTKGAQVAIALSHSYPMPRKKLKLTNERFVAYLKGVDAIVYRAMKAAGFDVSVKAVMERELDLHEKPYSSASIPQDGYGPLVDGSLEDKMLKDHGQYIYQTFLVTSDTFTFIHNEDLPVGSDPATTFDDREDEGFKYVVEEEYNAWPSPQLMWVKRPTDTFVDAGTYVAYSNEYAVDYFYSAAAFVLNVPPFGEKSRAF